MHSISNAFHHLCIDHFSFHSSLFDRMKMLPIGLCVCMWNPYELVDYWTHLAKRHASSAWSVSRGPRQLAAANQRNSGTPRTLSYVKIEGYVVAFYLKFAENKSRKESEVDQSQRYYELNCRPNARSLAKSLYLYHLRLCWILWFSTFNMWCVTLSVRTLFRIAKTMPSYYVTFFLGLVSMLLSASEPRWKVRLTPGWSPSAPMAWSRFGNLSLVTGII